jgi:hypothetical protein
VSPGPSYMPGAGLADQAAASPAHTPRRPGTRPEPHDRSSRQLQPHV